MTTALAEIPALMGTCSEPAVEVRPYCVVPARGCYGSGAHVRPVARYASLRDAWGHARRETRRHQTAMRRHGGGSGGYRVIRDEWGSECIRGWALDRIPDAQD